MMKLLTILGGLLMATTPGLAEDKGPISETSSLPGGAPLDAFALKLLNVAPEQLAQWERAEVAGVMEIKAVHLPVDPPGDCNHYGWPIATMTGDTLIVMHRRNTGHKPDGAGIPNEKATYGMVLRSTDGGVTWSSPYDLRECMSEEDRARDGLVPLTHRYKFDPTNGDTRGYKLHMHAIGTTRDRAVVIMNNHGVFRSEDEGRTWRHFSRAFRDDTFRHPSVLLGPNVVDHPDAGLLAFGNIALFARWTPGQPPKQIHEQKLVVLQSRDGGATWTAADQHVGINQHEPAALRDGSRVLLVTREQVRRVHMQMTWVPDKAAEVIETNLHEPPGEGIDTVDISFNPVTQRYEMVRSERYRGQLWLWSMAPADWGTGQWTRECRLLARGGKFIVTGDGFHPAGAVIDVKRGVQHLFIYTGHPKGPAGVFRITRTLDTQKLRQFLTPDGE